MHNGRRLDGKYVLVVEDDYLVAHDLVDALHRYGARPVGPFATTQAAMDAIRDHSRIDAAVLDINVGGTMVYPVSDMLREKNIPFVFATGYDVNAIPRQYQDVQRCEKPVDVGAVVRLLERQMSRVTRDA